MKVIFNMVCQPCPRHIFRVIFRVKLFYMLFSGVLCRHWENFTNFEQKFNSNIKHIP